MGDDVPKGTRRERRRAAGGEDRPGRGCFGGQDECGGERREIERRLSEKDAEGVLEYISIYADSVVAEDAEDKRKKNARTLLKYLADNRNGLIPAGQTPRGGRCRSWTRC